MAGPTYDIHAIHPFDKLKTFCRIIADNYLNWVDSNYNINSKQYIY